MNKHEERFYVERAAEMLNLSWSVGEDRESPDFIISEGDWQFGLEVSELFTGPVGRKGSGRKAMESNHQETIDRYRDIYVAEKDIPLSVRILGPVNDETMGELLGQLLQRDFEWTPLGHQIIVQPNDQLKVYVTKALRSFWFRVDDRVGMVNTNPIPIIQGRVAMKSRRLINYHESAGEDVRLLLVANRMLNNGRLKLVKQSALDTCGFRVVYFLSFPESVTVFQDN